MGLVFTSSKASHEFGWKGTLINAHVKAFLLGSSENLIVEKGQTLLGAKQSLFFVEMDGGRPREIYIKILGE